MEQIRQRVREMGAASVFGLVIAVVLIIVVVLLLLQLLTPGSEDPTFVGRQEPVEDTRDVPRRAPDARDRPGPGTFAGGSGVRPGAPGRSDVVEDDTTTAAGVAQPFVRTDFGDRQVERVHRDLRRLSTAIREFVDITGRLPNTLEELTNPRPGRLDGLLDGLPIPTDPWQRDYLFLTENGRVYLRTLGEDGKPGGEGYFADIELEL